MKEQIKFNRTIYATGRNGDIKQSGLQLTSLDDHIRIKPLTSNGEVANCLINIPAENLDEVIKALIALRPAGNDEKFKIYDIWSVDDIIGKAKEDSKFTDRITPAKAKQILLHVEKYHDADFGINWDVIDTHTEMYFNDLDNGAELDPDVLSKWQNFVIHNVDGFVPNFDVEGLLLDQTWGGGEIIAKVRDYRIDWIDDRAKADFQVHQFIKDTVQSQLK